MKEVQNVTEENNLLTIGIEQMEAHDSIREKESVKSRSQSSVNHGIFMGPSAKDSQRIQSGIPNFVKLEIFMSG